MEKFNIGDIFHNTNLTLYIIESKDYPHNGGYYEYIAIKYIKNKPSIKMTYYHSELSFAVEENRLQYFPVKRI